MDVPVVRQRVQRPVSRPRPPVADRVAPIGRRPPVPTAGALQERWGNRGASRLLSRLMDESQAELPMAEAPMPFTKTTLPFAETPVPFAEPQVPVTRTPVPFSAAREPLVLTPAPFDALGSRAPEPAPVPRVGPAPQPEPTVPVVPESPTTAPKPRVVPPAGVEPAVASDIVADQTAAERPGMATAAASSSGTPASAAAAEAPAPVPVVAAPASASGAAGAPVAPTIAPAPAPAEVPTPPSAEEAIAPTVRAVSRRASQQRAHSPSAVPVANASASAREPRVEQRRSSAERTVDTIDAVPPGEVPKQSFKDALRRAIDEATPKPTTEEAAERVMAHGATDASAQLNAQLGVQREQAAGPLRSATRAEAPPAPEAGAPAPAPVPEPTGPAPEPVPAGPVVPAPLPPERLDYSADRGPTDQAMAEAGVTTEQLQSGNEPEFAPALEARTAAESHEAEAGPQYREREAAMRGEARAQAEAGVDGGLTGMRAQRLDLIGQVVGEQDSTRTSQSQERRLVTERVTAIREATRTDVEVILTAMDANAVAIFAVGLHEAEEAYERAFEDVKGGLGNWLTEWGSDWDRLIERALATGRASYLERVGRAIDEVAALVEGQLAAAKQRVAAGRAELDAYVAGLDESLRSTGEEARQKISADFDALEASIDDRRDRLVERLTQQYGESYQRMSETENRLREENKSLWQRVYDATVGVVRKILEFKEMLLSVLAGAASVVMLIISDPIQFLKNLIGAVMQGVTNFKDHIVAHLQKGLLDWIFGAVAGAGIQLPAKFDLAGILGLVLQILGLTWQNIRRIAVEIVGEPIVHALEMFAEPVIVLIREGPAGLWRWIQEKLSDLKTMLLDEIQSWLITNVVEAGIKWILGLLTPVGAFIKACKAIYDIVMFFVERAKQVADLVKAVTESVGAIARGSLGAAAQRVEDALARSIPVAIGLLASLLGLDNLSATIAKFIQRIRKPVEKAIRWLIGKAVELVKAAGRLLGIGKEEGSKEDAEHDAQVAAGLAALQAAVAQHEGGESSRSDAEAIASQVQSEHPIFTGIEVVDADESWRFHVTASDVKTNAELPKSGAGGKGVVKATWIPVKIEPVNLTAARIGRSKESAAFESRGKAVALHLLGERFPGRHVSQAITPAKDPTRGESTLDELRLASQMEFSDDGGPLGKRRPDYLTYVPVETAEGVSDELHIFDPTLNPKSYAELPERSETKPIPEMKAQQLFVTLALVMEDAKRREKNGKRRVSRINYTVITDRTPTDDIIKVIQDTQNSLNQQAPPTVEITWAVVETVK